MRAKKPLASLARLLLRANYVLPRNRAVNGRWANTAHDREYRSAGWLLDRNNRRCECEVVNVFRPVWVRTTRRAGNRSHRRVGRHRKWKVAILDLLVGNRYGARDGEWRRILPWGLIPALVGAG